MGYKTTSTDAEIIAAYRECGSIKQTMRDCQAGPKRVRRLVRSLPPIVGAQPQHRQDDELPIKRIPAKSLLTELDLPGKVRDALKRLGGDAVLDNDLRAALGIPTQQWAALRDLSEFKDHQLEHKGRRYWAGRDLITAAMERKNLV